MKKTILTSLLFLGLLVGCSKPNSSVSEGPGDDASDTEKLPEVPTDTGGNTNTGGNNNTGGDGTINGTVTIEKAIPAGWTYVSNNPKDYPDPAWYNSGGLKLNFSEMGLKSPTFAASAKTVVLSGGLNKNEKTGTSTTLAIYTVSGSTETLVRSAVFSTAGLTTYSESYSLPSGTTQFFIKLVANGGYNVDLKTIVVS